MTRTATRHDLDVVYSTPGTPPPEEEPAPGWNQSLARGAPGIALVHAVHAEAGVGDWATVHRWAAAMTRTPVLAHDDAGLFQGAPAVAFALRTIQAAAGHTTYARPLSLLDRHITELTRRRLRRAHQRIEEHEFPRLREFDLINGLTGIAAYLLPAGHTALLRDVLTYLVRLTQPLNVDSTGWPGWWTRNGPADQPAPHWPGGHANIGLAHGIAGPLALLATAARRGITVTGHLEAIDRIDIWLDGWRCGTPGRPWWPGMISATEWTTATITQPGAQRPSWCYGTPGLARARQLAALALRDTPRQEQAETALAGCVHDAQLALLGDPSLCHGWAGLLHTTARAAADNPAGPLPTVLARLRARYDQHRGSLDRRMSDPHGMLDGATGIALADYTLNHTPSHAGRSWWDACLLTAPTPKPLSQKGNA